MAATQVRIDGAPFDGVADRYDDTFTFTRIGQAQRNAVWRDLATTFHSGERILEIGCGTGVDACFLAKRGVRVVACDSSSRMVAVTECRVHENRLQKLVQPLQLHAEDIQALQASERFGGAFSNFGALNCVEDMAQFADDLANLMKPGAKALLCWIGPFCLWETVWYLSRGRSKKAFRRFQRNGSSRISEGVQAYECITRRCANWRRSSRRSSESQPFEESELPFPRAISNLGRSVIRNCSNCARRSIHSSERFHASGCSQIMC